MNLSTLIILIILIALVILIIRSMIKDKRNGKSSCGGNCGACGSNSLCRDASSLYDEYKKQKSK